MTGTMHELFVVQFLASAAVCSSKALHLDQPAPVDQIPLFQPELWAWIAIRVQRVQLYPFN